MRLRKWVKIAISIVCLVAFVWGLGLLKCPICGQYECDCHADYFYNDTYNRANVDLVYDSEIIKEIYGD